MTALKRRVAEKRLEFAFVEEKQGQTELFIQGKVGDTFFWIYEDMADIKTGDRSKVFEPPDYDSSEQLIAAFVNAVIPASQSQ